MNPINKASEGAETPASFAALYASNDSRVSAAGKPWIKSSFRPSGLTVLTSRINWQTERPKSKQKQVPPGVEPGTSSLLIATLANFLEIMTSIVARILRTLRILVVLLGVAGSGWSVHVTH
jgi:hypothetical protein